MSNLYDILDLTQEELKKLSFNKRVPKQHPDNGRRVLVKRDSDIIYEKAAIVRYDEDGLEDWILVFFEKYDGTIVTSVDHIWAFEDGDN